MHKTYKLSIAIIATLAFNYSCAVKNSINIDSNFPSFAYEGHRGARGLYPENSTGAMKVAIDLPVVTTLEMDCHITKDKKVVVFHDDFLNPKFVTYANGKELAGKDIKGLVYDYTYKQLQQFDLGLKGNVDFPQQKKVSTKIDLLENLVDESEKYAASKGKKMFYNIETKSSEKKDNKAHPEPKEFSDLLLKVVFEKGIESRTVIQSFDKRTIQYINKEYPSIRTSFLIDAKNKKSPQELVDELGYKPFIISPNYKIVTKQFVESAHKLGVKIIPWTVNTKEEIEALKALKVDGIISDYPNLF
ncbi:glycerophosphodiester phosphodiesterase family protein [Sphingobacterium bovistauri]|uniref:Glycerophosphodiester phosphodiesterase n=1 Tax=Sphingobacterium bovistauri TaxID=2781959 RepID=A0ABS7Z8S0_9SPHI|nr:glycerophosphodiester phosphodiesterase family protein [Sphingobacterium bovistauri]MCA5005260.1 glycerophosphodiester phosphodiesterase [Sphingobacterium bovistauri]